MPRRWTSTWLTGKRKQKSTNLATLANAENFALVNRLVDWLADVEEKKLGERKAKEKAEAKVGTLAEKITVCKSRHLATYCPWWRLTRKPDTSLQARAGRVQHTWPNIRQRGRFSLWRTH